MKPEKSAKRRIASASVTIGSFLFCLAAGVFLGRVVFRQLPHGSPETRSLLLLAALALFYVSLFLQTVLHEAGHLLAGLLSGYRFSSFRVGNFMWVRQDRRLRLSRLSLAGTSGQCLMSPPEMQNGTFPFMLYNLGGVLLNALTVPLCAAGWFFCRRIPFPALFFSVMGIAGLLVALLNGIPLRVNGLANDGRNACSARRCPEAARSLWVQLKVMEQASRGLRLKDMPAEWFYMPHDTALKNGLVAAMAVFYINRLLDGAQYAQAAEAADRLLVSDAELSSIHRSLLLSDRIFCELIGPCRRETVDALYTPELQKVMQQMQTNISVIRTRCAYALLVKNDDAEAALLAQQFEKHAAKHPYPGDIASEREMLALAQRRCLAARENAPQA